MRQARAGHDTCGQRVTPRCRWARARPGFEATRRAKLAARTAHGRVATHRHTQRPGTTGVEGAGGSGGHGRASRRRTQPHTATRRRRRGGRRRVRRARAGFEIDHSEPQARVWRSRGRPGPTAPGTPVGPQATQAGRPPPTGTTSSPAQQHTTRPDSTPRGATSNTAQGRGPTGPRP